MSAVLPAPGGASRAFNRLSDRLGLSPIHRRLARGSIWSIIGTTVARASTLVCGIIVARVVGKEQYGALGVIQGTVATFQILAGFGMGLTATKYVAEFRLSDPGRAGRIGALCGAFTAVTGGLFAAVLFAAAPWLSSGMLAAPELAGALRLGALLLFFGALLGVHSGALAGLEGFRALAVANTIGGVLAIPITFFGARYWGLTGAISGLVLSAAVNWLLVWWMYRVTARGWGVPLRIAGAGSEMAVIWRFGLPAVLATSLVVPVNWLCSTMLVNQPGGFGEMGIFNAANQWRLVILHLPAALNAVLTPILSERTGARDLASLRRLLRGAILVNGLIALPLFLGLALFGHSILGLYGSGFRDATGTLWFVLFVGFLMAVQSPVGYVLAATDRMWAGFLMNLGWGIVTLGLTKLLLSRGAQGLAVAQCGGYLVHGIWTFAFALRVLRGDRNADGTGAAPVR